MRMKCCSYFFILLKRAFILDSRGMSRVTVLHITDSTKVNIIEINSVSKVEYQTTVRNKLIVTRVKSTEKSLNFETH